MSLLTRIYNEFTTDFFSKLLNMHNALGIEREGYFIINANTTLNLENSEHIAIYNVLIRMATNKNMQYLMLIKD